MHGDYTRDTFGPTAYYGHGFLQPQEHFTRLLMQQGRPLTDADWNEQSAQILELTRALARTVIGWHGSSDCGFKFNFDSATNPPNTHLCRGHYYVDGIRCEHPNNLELDPDDFTDWIKDLSNSIDSGVGLLHHLIYLDVWEQSVAHVEESQLREPSLLPVDTCNRSRTRWAMRVLKGDEYRVVQVDHAHVYKLRDAQEPEQKKLDRDELYRLIDGATPEDRILHVRINEPDVSDTTPCDTAPRPDSKQNRQAALYRVEIDQGSKSPTGAQDLATFKWSRENGAAVFPLAKGETGGSSLKLRNTSQTPGYQLQDGDWIEVLDEHGDPVSSDDAIVQINRVCEDRLELARPVTPGTFHHDAIALSEGVPKPAHTGQPDPHYVRRWFPSGTAEYSDVTPTSSNTLKVKPRHGAYVQREWIALEHGIEIKFSPTAFQRGDYWLIDVRRNPGSDEISIVSAASNERNLYTDAGIPLPLRGWHVYAPLGFFAREAANRNGGHSFRKLITPTTPQPPIEANTTSYPFCNPISPCCGPDPEPDPDGAVPTAPSVPAAAPLPRIIRNSSSATEVLSQAGVSALRKYFKTPREVLRRIPARFLNTTVSYQPLAQWLGPALVSEIVGVSFEEFDERFRMTFSVADEDKDQYEREVRRLLATAEDFSHMMSTEAGIKNMIA